MDALVSVYGDGTVISAQPGFIELLRTEWSTFDGVRLPAPLRDMVACYVEGRPYTDIATELAITPTTVRRHLPRAYERLDVHSKTEMVTRKVTYSTVLGV